MSEIQSDAGGVVIISQMNPSSNLQEVPDQIHNKPKTMPKPITLFYKGEPEALGVTQIISGILIIIFGVILCIVNIGLRYFFDLMIVSGVPFWSGLTLVQVATIAENLTMNYFYLQYIISGSLSVSAAQKPTVGKVKSSLVLNIISSVFATLACIVCIMGFIIQQHFYSYNSYCFYYKQSNICEGHFNPQAVVVGIMTLIFLLTILQFCITISTAVFGCKAVCRTSYNETTVIIYQTSTINAPNNSTSADGTLSTMDDLTQ